MAIEEISLRLNPSFYDEHSKTLYVDVELRYQGHGYFKLADQNYRLFYDSEFLSLQEDLSRSDLPQDLYSQLEFMETYENLQADNVNQLAFDDQLGFINFNIDLYNAVSGGIKINQEDNWQRVAVLNFKVEDKEALSQIVWSKAGATDGYATAFVEIMEWVAPNETEPALIQDMIDASFDGSEENDKFELAVAPNPTTDFIKLSFEHTLEYNHTVVVSDASGKEVKNTLAFRGADNINVSVADLAPGTYNIHVRSEDANKDMSTTFVKINR